ncbi:hypothetical protein IQ06DRAFT_350064 [Phaeosphaeriaceae sp. SRC1lsM3a]|nr:hypothetical protein IQ06DRAFT_350064 [Stagonospora sp. SRC1lsM3a]
MSFASKLAKLQSGLFRINYASGYKTFIPNHIVADRLHPLNETQKRRAQARKKEGLWWHVTTGVDLSKSSCVRSWARRRLRTAFVEELQARGYNEDGTFDNLGAASTKSSSIRLPIRGNSPNLTGSLRLHVLAPLLPAKFVEVKAAVGGIIDAMLGGTHHKGNTAADVKKPLKLPRKVVPADSSPHKPPTAFTRLKPS